MTGLEEPILSRLNRLDNILKQLEDIRSAGHSPKSSYASTTSSGTLTSDGHPFSLVDFSPESLEKHCRPVDEVIMERAQGELIGLARELCLQWEEELEGERSKEHSTASLEKSSPKKGLKQFVKSCVKGKAKNKKNR
ncbi:UNVERIFIED_CONTAM: hypothetical protein Scaly_2686900 [Sesamum calycinum]|uniref:Uncharacterized protein n=1 Tax=Sesamum calycinum TaxID=2727403 RepID=A0AAW2J604_9LAMI